MSFSIFAGAVYHLVANLLFVCGKNARWLEKTRRERERERMRVCGIHNMKFNLWFWSKEWKCQIKLRANCKFIAYTHTHTNPATIVHKQSIYTHTSIAFHSYERHDAVEWMAWLSTNYWEWEKGETKKIGYNASRMRCNVLKWKMCTCVFVLNTFYTKYWMKKINYLSGCVRLIFHEKDLLRKCII